MKKYYTAYMIILDPKNLNNSDITITYENVIVEKTIFGYQEIFTNHKFFIYKNAFEKNQKYNNKNFPWTIKNAKILSYLKKGSQFYLLDFKSIKSAKKRDVKEYIEDFYNNKLKIFYENKKQQEIKNKNKKIEKHQENIEIKKLIKNYKKDFKTL